MQKRIIVGISGATGIQYGYKALQRLNEQGFETHLIMSKSAEMVRSYETELSHEDITSMADHVHAARDVGAVISSGSFRTRGMLIAPCSVNTLAEIASGVTSTLMSRAADVVLKERRRLVLMVRETPLHLGHIRNMEAVTEVGAIVMPPVPALYLRPQSIDEMIDHSVSRALDLFGIDTEDSRWEDFCKR